MPLDIDLQQLHVLELVKRIKFYQPVIDRIGISRFANGGAAEGKENPADYEGVKKSMPLAGPCGVNR